MRHARRDVLFLAPTDARCFFTHSRSLRGLRARVRAQPFDASISLLLLLARDGFRRSLAGAGIGMRTLAAHRQTAPVTQPAIAAEIHQPLDVHRRLAAQIALDGVV